MKDSLKTVKFLFSYFLKRDKLLLLLMFLEQILPTFTIILTIIFPKLIIDELIGTQRIETVIAYVAIYSISIFLINTIAKFLWAYNFTRLDGKLRAKFDAEIGEHTANIKYKYLEMPEILDLKEKAKQSMYQNQLFAGSLTMMLTLISQVVVLATILGIIVTLDVFILLFVVLILAFNFHIRHKSNRKLYDIDVQKTPFTRKSNYFKQTTSDFSYGKEIRLNNLISVLTTKFRESKIIENDYHKKTYAINSQISFWLTATTFIQTAIVYIFLAYEVLYNNLEIGNFTMYFAAITQFAMVINQFATNVTALTKVGYTLDDYDKYMALEKGNVATQTTPNITEKLVFEFVDVSFKYDGADDFALKNVNIKIDFAQKLSIVGLNGAGKTTFIKLLTRLYEPTEGKILLNGINISCLDYKEYTSLFSVVFQDFKLFFFTIKDNITTGELDKSKFKNVLEKSGLSSKIESLPQKEETYVYKIFDENGIEFSGGESQKLATARALYKDSPIVILDEVASALDPRAEYETYQMFDDLVQSKTAIYISHRLASTRFCDKVAVFEDGHIVECGSHDELIKNDGLYAELFSKQAEFYVEIKS